MLTVTRRSFAISTLLAAASLAVAQTSTNTVTYQGVLNQNGSPIADGTYALTFKLYDAATGGTEIEAISVPGVSTNKGLFTALVPVTAASFSGPDRWWSVALNGIELLPRQKVTAAPYSVFSSSTLGMSVDAAGKVGFGGRPTNTDRVQIFGSTGQWLLALQNVGLPPDGANLAFIDNGWDPASGANKWWIQSAFAHNGGWRTGSQQVVLGYDGSNTYLAMNVGGQPQGFVGVGTAQPTARLDVNGTMKCSVLTITGGADLAEPVVVSTSGSSLTATPGMVMVIDREHDGQLVPCTAAYDKAVAGVISGANGINPGMLMHAEGQRLADVGDATMPLAMTGRVWVLCDATAQPIHRGDALTTSSTPGHAMAVTDESQRAGAVIGKAMTALPNGKGLVLVLVNLQ